MKIHILFLLIAVVAMTFTEAQNIQNLLKDKRYVERQIKCILDQGYCDAIGNKIKDLLPEALNNQCRHCTPRQMAHARTLIAFMKQNYPQEWHNIVQRYSATRNNKRM